MDSKGGKGRNGLMSDAGGLHAWPLMAQCLACPAFLYPWGVGEGGLLPSPYPLAVSPWTLCNAAFVHGSLRGAGRGPSAILGIAIQNWRLRSNEIILARTFHAHTPTLRILQHEEIGSPFAPSGSLWHRMPLMLMSLRPFLSR